MIDDKKINMTMKNPKPEKESVKSWRKKPAKDPFLAVLSGVEKGKKILLVASVTTIGRSVHNSIQLKDPRSSRQHARIEKESSGQFSITDLDSANGTWVNGRKVATQPLTKGDHIIIGSTEFLLTIPDSDDDAEPKE